MEELTELPIAFKNTDRTMITIIAFVKKGDSQYKKIELHIDEDVNINQIENRVSNAMDFIFPLDEELMFYKLSKSYEKIKFSDFQESLKLAIESFRI